MSDFPGPDTTAELRQATSSSAWVQAMLDFEAALAAAEAEQGLIPAAAAQAISGAARAQDFDPEALAAIAAVSSNPTLALIEALRRRVGAEAAPWVHLGATSQDVLDTAAMLVTARALQLLRPDLERAASSCARLVRDHRSTLQLARTLLQPAVPTTLGLRAAGWLVALLEALDRLASLGRDRLALQLGGAGGTQAGLGPAAEAVSQALATRLGLGLPALPWHADRARMAQVGFELALAAGVCAKIATDVLLLSQAELGELREGGAESPSSAMPHKRNAGQAVMIRAAWQRVPGLAASLLAAMTPELDRGAGSWQGDSTTLGELLRLTGGAAQRLVRLLEGLEVDGARMAANLERFAGEAIAEGLAAALTPRLGRERALGLAAEIAREPAGGGRRRLEQELGGPGEISEAELDRLLSPARHLGDASRLIDRALALADERGLG